MTTSVFPPSRLSSFIDCPNCDNNVTFGESYYTLVNLTNERYQFTVPVSLSVDSNTVLQQYRCRIRFVTISENGYGHFITGQQRSVSATGETLMKYRVIIIITFIILASRIVCFFNYY